MAKIAQHGGYLMESHNAINMENWTILCPGPSLNSVVGMKGWFAEHRDEVGVIAVNGAILHLPFAIDYWAVVDPEVFTTVSKLMDLENLSSAVKIWTYWGFEDMGRSHDGARWDDNVLSLAQKFEKEVWHRPENPDDIKEQYPESIVPFKTPEVEIPWNEFTVFTAISLAIKKGARSITLYGADMAGEGYFKSGLTNWRMNHKENRWFRERHYMNHIICACASRGIKIDVFQVIKPEKEEKKKEKNGSSINKA
jgi:hypothetical protein